MLKLIKLAIGLLGVILLNSCSNLSIKKDPYPDAGTANEPGTRIRPYNAIEPNETTENYSPSYDEESL